MSYTEESPFAAHESDTSADMSRRQKTGSGGNEVESAAQHISTYADRILAELTLRAEFGDDAVGGESVGFQELDKELIVEAGKLIYVGAREGVGKTAWALQTARYMATRKNAQTGLGGTVVYFITEMGVQETVERILVSFAQLEARSLKRGVTQETIDAVRKAFALLERSGLYIVNAAGWHVDQLVGEARAFRAAHQDLRAVFVDNLTGIAPSATRRSQGLHEYVGEIVEKLNMLAMTDKGLAVPVFLLGHLTRPERLARHKEPTSLDIAGSDKVNRWANAIVLLHERSDDDRVGVGSGKPSSPVAGFGGGGASVVRPNLLGTGAFGEDLWTSPDGRDTWSPSDIGSADVGCSHVALVTKNRGGRKFRCDLNFIGAQMRFEDPAGDTLRPYEMPDPEPERRSEFRRRMQELGDL
jgi:replicative DNA helicase